jgi:hypothetical protein
MQSDKSCLHWRSLKASDTDEELMLHYYLHCQRFYIRGESTNLCSSNLLKDLHVLKICGEINEVYSISYFIAFSTERNIWILILVKR